MPTYVQLRTTSLGIHGRPATHNPLVHGSSPCGPTILKAAHCAAFGFLGRRRGRQGHRGSGQQPVDQRLLVIVERLILVELVGGRDQRLALDLTPTVTIDMPKVLQRLQVAVL